jgi:hypothetical protein
MKGDASAAHEAREGNNVLQAQGPEVHLTSKQTYSKMKIKNLKLHKNIGFPALLTSSGRIIPTAELVSHHSVYYT